VHEGEERASRVTVIGGILLVVLGIAFPMGTLIWLSGRMGGQPSLTSRQIGLILALNGILPVALITLGVGLLTGKLWSSLEFKVVLMASSFATVVVIAVLWRTTKSFARAGNRDGR
jgi:hypothetical protein